MRHLTAECFPKTDLISDVLNTNMSSNADVTDTPKLASRDAGIDQHGAGIDQHGAGIDQHDVGIDQHGAGIDQHGVGIDKKGVTDSHMASAGEPLASASVTSDVVEAPESTQAASVTSDAPSSTEYVITVTSRSRGVRLRVNGPLAC